MDYTTKQSMRLYVIKTGNFINGIISKRSRCLKEIEYFICRLYGYRYVFFKKIIFNPAFYYFLVLFIRHKIIVKSPCKVTLPNLHMRACKTHELLRKKL